MLISALKINKTEDLIVQFKLLSDIDQARLIISLGDKFTTLVSNLDQFIALLQMSHYRSLAVMVDKLDKRFHAMVTTMASLEKVLAATPNHCKELMVNLTARQLVGLVRSSNDLIKIVSVLNASASNRLFILLGTQIKEMIHSQNELLDVLRLCDVVGRQYILDQLGDQLRVLLVEPLENAELKLIFNYSSLKIRTMLLRTHSDKILPLIANMDDIIKIYSCPGASEFTKTISINFEKKLLLLIKSMDDLHELFSRTNEDSHYQLFAILADKIPSLVNNENDLVTLSRYMNRDPRCERVFSAVIDHLGSRLCLIVKNMHCLMSITNRVSSETTLKILHHIDGEFYHLNKTQNQLLQILRNAAKDNYDSIQYDDVEVITSKAGRVQRQPLLPAMFRLLCETFYSDYRMRVTMIRCLNACYRESLLADLKIHPSATFFSQFSQQKFKHRHKDIEITHLVDDVLSKKKNISCLSEVKTDQQASFLSLLVTFAVWSTYQVSNKPEPKVATGPVMA